MHVNRRTVAVFVAVMLVASCSSGGEAKEANGEIELEEQTNEGVNALVASYDLAAGSPQRFLVGLVTNDQQLISFGDAELAFSFLGDGESDAEPVPGPTATAAWQPIPGQKLDSTPMAATVGDAVDGTGVYAAREVIFDEPGFWQDDVTVEVDGDT